jgi:hypothetical protein
LDVQAVELDDLLNLNNINLSTSMNNRYVSYNVYILFHI